MKMGDPGYFERETRHDKTTSELRDNAKDAVAFYLTIDALRKDGINIPENLHYSTDFVEFSKTMSQIGSIIAKAKGLTIDDASPELKRACIRDSKEVRDMNIGWEYFSKLQEKQRKRVLNKDVEHITYYSSYGQNVNISEIIEKIKLREAQSARAKAAKTNTITG